MVAEAEGAAAIEKAVFRESFESFYRREVSAVVGLAYALSGSRIGAEDLAQEGFLAALRQWDRISSYDDPGAWVRRVVANRAVSVIRRRTAEARAILRLGRPEAEITEMPSESAFIWEEVRRLPKRQAQVIVLRYVDGQGISQIAHILECSENTVKTHLRRAKNTLAKRLGREVA
ncbi:MAG: RNA polymerase sigma factor [Acidimicrobiia bacterium]